MELSTPDLGQFGPDRSQRVWNIHIEADETGGLLPIETFVYRNNP